MVTRVERLRAGVRSVVVGLETLAGPGELAAAVAGCGERVVLSLDLREGQPLGDLAGWGTAEPVAIAERAVVGQTEVHAAVAGQRVEFDEGVLIQQRQDALAGGQLAPGVHLLDRRLTNRMQRLFGPPAQVSQLAGSGVDVRLVLGGRLCRVVGNARHGR